MSTAPEAVRAPLRVFISYSHDDEIHEGRVRGLADSLRRDGLDCVVDQYLSQTPHDGWPLWMQKQIQTVDKVLLVCTETYLRRVEKREESTKGHGACWGANIVYVELYESNTVSQKFLPILFKPSDQAYIPVPLRGFTHYIVNDDAGYHRLYRALTGQPNVTLPPLGPIKVLGGSPSPRLFASPDDEEMLTTRQTVVDSLPGTPTRMRAGLRGRRTGAAFGRRVTPWVLVLVLVAAGVLWWQFLSNRQYQGLWYTISQRPPNEEGRCLCQATRKSPSAPGAYDH